LSRSSSFALAPDGLVLVLAQELLPGFRDHVGAAQLELALQALSRLTEHLVEDVQCGARPVLAFRAHLLYETLDRLVDRAEELFLGRLAALGRSNTLRLGALRLPTRRSSPVSS
jgi:hypothetical protein